MASYANYSVIFPQWECKNVFSQIIRKSGLILLKEPQNQFENSWIPRYKLKIKTGLNFYRGSYFCILLHFSVHLLLTSIRNADIRKFF